MNIGNLSRLRIVIAAVVGSVIALATAAGIFLNITVDPKTLHLSDRVDAKRTLAYISSSNRDIFFDGLRRYETLMTNKRPTEQDIAPADRYEFALLRTGSGVTEWIVDGRNEQEGTHATVVSTQDASLLLPISERKQALSRSSLFQHLRANESSFAWFDVQALPLPESTAATLVRSLLSPYKEGLLMTDGQGKGHVILQGKTALRSGAMDMTQDDEMSAAISLSDPLALIASMTMDMEKRDPELLEGLTGILKSRLAQWTGSTDLTILKGLLAGSVSLQTQQEEGRTLFAILGTASENDTLQSFLDKASSVMMEGNVRRMEFLDEYSRHDVTAATTSSLTELAPYNGWTMRRLGSTGSSLTLFIASSGRKYVLGNDESLVKHMTGVQRDDGRLGSGSLDMTWVSSETEARLPFLLPLRPTVEALLGPSPARLTWQISGISGGVSAEWTLTRAIAE